MRRNIFNRHRIKKKWGRGFKKASRFVLASEEKPKRRDFAWRRTKANPLWHDEEKKGGTKQKMVIIIMAGILMIGLGLFHSFFQINEIEIKGLQRIATNEMENAVRGMIGYKKLLIFPGNNYFLVRVDEIKDVAMERFPLESIIVKKLFPNSLEIQVEEKISTIIYDNGKEYSYLDTDGNIVEIIRKIGNEDWEEKTEITTSTNELGEIIEETKIIERIHKPNIKNIIIEMGDYPIVYNSKEEEGGVNNNVMKAETALQIINWFNLINKDTNIPFGYIIIEDELDHATIKTREGWEIRIRMEEKVQEQFDELQFVLKEKVDRKKLNYIDLRYLGKVYWQ